MRWRTQGGHDVWTLAGIGVVALSAAVLSFASLQDLAERAGYTRELAALLPVAIDAQAVVATRAWLATTTSATARRYARALALSAVGLSVVGNAGQHAMAAAKVATPWQVVVLIAAVPPIALAATAHLAALLATHSIEDLPAIEQTEPTPAPADRGSTDADARSTAGDHGRLGTPEHGPEQRESSPTRAGDAAQHVSAPAARSIADLRAEFTTAIESASIEIDPSSAESIRRVLRCSPKRARQLRDEHATRPRLAVVGEHQ